MAAGEQAAGMRSAMTATESAPASSIDDQAGPRPGAETCHAFRLFEAIARPVAFTPDLQNSRAAIEKGGRGFFEHTPPRLEQRSVENRIKKGELQSPS